MLYNSDSINTHDSMAFTIKYLAAIDILLSVSDIHLLCPPDGFGPEPVLQLLQVLGSLLCAELCFIKQPCIILLCNVGSPSHYDLGLLSTRSALIYLPLPPI